jgi:hypothetical protein
VKALGGFYIQLYIKLYAEPPYIKLSYIEPFYVELYAELYMEFYIELS